MSSTTYDYVIIGGGISGLYMYMKLIMTKGSNIKILLLEKNKYFGGRIYQHNDKRYGISYPAGAARFNKSHHRVIKLLKKFHLLDFRKEKGSSAQIRFIYANNKFSSFKNKSGFHYIERVLSKMKNESRENLMNHTFQEFASKVLEQDEVDFMLIASGYSGQLKFMNAFDAYHLFSEGIRVDVPYWSGKFHLLIEKMVAHLQYHNASLINNADVADVLYENKKYKITYNSKCISSDKVIVCAPKNSLLHFSCFRPIQCILKNSVTCKPLCRVYALFDKNDPFIDMMKQKTVTNNALRYVIPMDPEKRLIMISYTDDDYTEFWSKKSNDQALLKKTVVKLVKEAFQVQIREPKKVFVHHWKCGVAYWNKGVDSDIVSTFVTNPLPNIYICGENYSRNQSWVEGALESCDRCLALL